MRDMLTTFVYSDYNFEANLEKLDKTIYKIMTHEMTEV